MAIYVEMRGSFKGRVDDGRMVVLVVAFVLDDVIDVFE